MRNNLVVVSVSLLHIVWGFALLSAQTNLHTTTIDSVVQFIQPYWLAAVILITASVMSFVSLHLGLKYRRIALALLLPQQFMLVMSCIGAAQAVILSHYADGVPRPWEFILADQSVILIITALHTGLLIYHFARKPIYG